MLDIEKLLREGKSLDEIGKLVSEELNTAQTKIDSEKQAEPEAEKLSKRKTEAREAAVAALVDYFPFVIDLPIDEATINKTLDELEEGFEMLKKYKVSINGSEFLNLLDLLK